MPRPTRCSPRHRGSPAIANRTVGVLDDWYERAAASPQRIVLADNDPRAHEAAARLRTDGLAEPVVIGRDLGSLADAAHPEADELVAELAAVADGPWAGRPLDIDDPLTIAAALVKSGWADGAVAGATRPTGDVIRAGIRVLDVAPEVSVVSSSFFFVLPDGRPLVYGDCGVLPDPTADQLAAVAISSAATLPSWRGKSRRWRCCRSRRRAAPLIRGSTRSSRRPHGFAPRARSRRRRRVAVRRSLRPRRGRDQSPGSPVAGRANVYVFPDLDSGNIAYKITERLGGAQAFGPLLQGLDGVLHDLSRGCCVEDIVNVAVISALQAGNSA